MDFQNPQVLQALAAVIMTAIAFVSLVAVLWYQTRRVSAVTQALEAQQATHAGTGIFDIVLSQYLDRHFTSAEPPEVDGRRVERIRELKSRAQKQRQTDKEAWAKASIDSQARGWENRLAYELSIAMERVGIAVFTGVVPAGFFLALAADQVLDDWMLCEDWVTNYRKSESARDPKVGVYFHRRHGEWLFLLSALWMERSFPKYPPLAQACRNRSPLKEDFVKLTRLESSLMPEWVQLQIARIVQLQPSELR